MSNLASITLPAQLKIFEQRFKDEVTTEHIEYGWDAGHCYSYISHPIMDEWDDLITRVAGDDYDYWYDMFADFTNEWLYQNDDCPPCAIHVDHVTKKIKSGCGCHDDLEYEEGLETMQELKDFLESKSMTTTYYISEEF